MTTPSKAQARMTPAEEPTDPQAPELTPAVERAVDVLIEHRDIVCVTGSPEIVARDILEHALNANEMARALHALHGTSLDTCSACEFRAEHFRAHLLGSDQ